eukprot:TRINITY_DN2224_c0_g1_i7.p1 TRINITY_DN2224_c0_g1~~TRINITY_DN2224_c0_g1_i7.p1  ORF type:complete len:491 (-),score=63.10 TRINITY_DN2224_c0_g1_i7:306-1625(-)
MMRMRSASPRSYNMTDSFQGQGFSRSGNMMDSFHGPGTPRSYRMGSYNGSSPWSCNMDSCSRPGTPRSYMMNSFGGAGGACVVPCPPDPMESRMLRLAMYGMRSGNPDLESEEQLTLYHATTEDNLSMILEDGFHPQFMNGYRGSGIYFSKSIPEAERQCRARAPEIIIECSVLVGRMKSETFNERDGYMMEYSDTDLMMQGYDSCYYPEQGEFMIPTDFYDQIHIEAVHRNGRRCNMTRHDSAMPFLYQMRESRRGLRQLCMDEQRRLHAMYDGGECFDRSQMNMNGMSPRSGQWGCAGPYAQWQPNNGMHERGFMRSSCNDDMARDIMDSFYQQKQQYLREQVNFVNEMQSSYMHRSPGNYGNMDGYGGMRNYGNSGNYGNCGNYGNRYGPSNSFECCSRRDFGNRSVSPRRFAEKYEGMMMGDNCHDMNMRDCYRY